MHSVSPNRRAHTPDVVTADMLTIASASQDTRPMTQAMVGRMQEHLAAGATSLPTLSTRDPEGALVSVECAAGCWYSFR